MCKFRFAAYVVEGEIVGDQLEFTFTREGHPCAWKSISSDYRSQFQFQLTDMLEKQLLTLPEYKSDLVRFGVDLGAESAERVCFYTNLSRDHPEKKQMVVDQMQLVLQTLNEPLNKDDA